MDRLTRWRLLLGPDTAEKLDSMGGSPLTQDETLLDEALAALYDETSGGVSSYKGSKGAGSGKSKPGVARWLGDIRAYFSEDLVSVIQADAIERKGLTQLLLEPETLKSVKPDLNIVQTIMALSGKIPDKAKETAREVVGAVVEEINRRLEQDLRRAVAGALNRREHSPIPSAAAVDWKTTVRRNIKNYNRDLERIVPDRFFFFDRAQKRNKWTIILDMDQSGSMADSVVYGSIAGCIFSSMSSLKTRVVAFDTEIVDLSEKYGSDPVDMIFGVQLGGGTDIEKSLAYCQTLIATPANTLFILISDLFEGGNRARMFARFQDMKDSGVKAVCFLALSDQGKPSYDENTAKRLASMGVPCFACTPTMLPPLIEGVLKGRDIAQLARDLTASRKE
ncbi:VWA domain-containing protein [Alphaproteobacteria bacterium]|nr:VWA domain-containing protein [Alphaproteobacteria bacterium]